MVQEGNEQRTIMTVVKTCQNTLKEMAPTNTLLEPEFITPTSIISPANHLKMIENFPVCIECRQMQPAQLTVCSHKDDESFTGPWPDKNLLSQIHLPVKRQAVPLSGLTMATRLIQLMI